MMTALGKRIFIDMKDIYHKADISSNAFRKRWV